MAIWYLSFADEEGWLGGVHLEADGFMEAVILSRILGVNPGGEVAGLDVSDAEMNPPVRSVLGRFFRTRAELEATFNELTLPMFDEHGELTKVH